MVTGLSLAGERCGETRNPTDAEIGEIEQATQKMGFVERADKTYEELLAEIPTYVIYLVEEVKKDHIDVKKPAHRFKKKVINAGNHELASFGGPVKKARRRQNDEGVRRNVYHRVEFGFLVISGWWREENTFEECYQCEIQCFGRKKTSTKGNCFPKLTLVGFGRMGFSPHGTLKANQWEAGEMVVASRNFLLA